MPSQNNLIAVALGIVSALLAPAMLLMAGHGILKSLHSDVGPLAPGPTCKFIHRTNSVSQDGRFIATLLSVVCEDDLNWPRGYNNLFVSATRLDMAAHILTLTRNANVPPSIFWNGNNAVVVDGQESESIEYSQSWCGISALFMVSPRR